MTQPTPPSPEPSPEPPEIHPPETTAQQREGVLRQRRHIEALDGEDPLRGGVAD